MSVTATGNAAAHVGDAVNYTLVATNVGPNVAPAAQLTFQLAAGLTIPELLADFPYLERADVLAALEFAAAAVQERELPLAHSA